MLRIGLTGGIGAGKSTVAGWLAGRGALVVDADRLAREVVEPGTPGLRALVEQFGPQILREDPAAGPVLDRPALGRLVFGDEAARHRLEAITHPLIAARTAEILAAADPATIVVHDVPLLVEKRMGAGYHLVVVVHADAEERVRRLRTLRGMDEETARARVGSQAGDAERRAAADVWLENEGGTASLAERVHRLWDERLAPFDANLIARRRAERGSARVVAPDPAWPDTARRLIGRIRRWLGEEDLPIEHIGSTAVAGLPAEDVIDLMLGVADLDAADLLRPALEAAGFARVEGIVRDHPHAGVDPDPGAWQKRFHASCDPGRPVNLHVRVVGGPGWRTALLVRDWLRDDSGAREEYAALKRSPADGVRTQGEYADAKEPWVAGAVDRALSARRATGGC